MKVTLSKDGLCGKVLIPKGEYLVALASDSQQMILTGGGKQFKIPAVRRRATGKSKVTTVSFYCGGGPTWSLLITTPKFGEWIAMIELGVVGQREEKEKRK